jgi:hypothetical protein
MARTIRTTFMADADPHQLGLQLAGVQQRGVKSGCALSAAPSPFSTPTPAVQIGAGEFWTVDGMQVQEDGLGSNVATPADPADPTNPRVDVVCADFWYVDSPEKLPFYEILEGTPAENPIPTDTTGNNQIVIGYALLPANAVVYSAFYPAPMEWRYNCLLRDGQEQVINGAFAAAKLVFCRKTLPFAPLGNPLVGGGGGCLAGWNLFYLPPGTLADGAAINTNAPSSPGAGNGGWGLPAAFFNQLGLGQATTLQAIVSGLVTQITAASGSFNPLTDATSLADRLAVTMAANGQTLVNHADLFDVDSYTGLLGAAKRAPDADRGLFFTDLLGNVAPTLNLPGMNAPGALLPGAQLHSPSLAKGLTGYSGSLPFQINSQMSGSTPQFRALGGPWISIVREPASVTFREFILSSADNLVRIGLTINFVTFAPQPGEPATDYPFGFTVARFGGAVLSHDARHLSYDDLDDGTIFGVCGALWQFVARRQITDDISMWQGTTTPRTPANYNVNPLAIPTDTTLAVNSSGQIGAKPSSRPMMALALSNQVVIDNTGLVTVLPWNDLSEFPAQGSLFTVVGGSSPNGQIQVNKACKVRISGLVTFQTTYSGTPPADDNVELSVQQSSGMQRNCGQKFVNVGAKQFEPIQIPGIVLNLAAGETFSINCIYNRGGSDGAVSLVGGTEYYQVVYCIIEECDY